MKKKNAKRPRRALLLGLAAVTSGLLLVIGGKMISVPGYSAIRVFDGDTFETKEKQYIRLSGIDTPEIGRCGSEEAKKELEKLILGKKLYIKILYHQGARSNGLVYTEDGLVNEAMLASGWAVLNDRDNVDMPELQKATNEARKKKTGIFSPRCTQTVNPTKPNCVIKGNVLSNKVKTYHIPSCQQYKLVEVQLYKGDQWFCTEQEAQQADFIKTTQCR